MPSKYNRTLVQEARDDAALKQFKDNKFYAELLDIEKLVKANGLKEVTNPVFFVKSGQPTPDGLLSNEIFGITKYDRSNTFAYIDLKEEFLNPLFYEIWTKLDKQIKECIAGTKRFIINKDGHLEPSDDGEYGIQFLKKNINNIKIKTSDSNRRDLMIDFFNKFKNSPSAFIKKWIVLPAYYRDVNTENGRMGVGEINDLYRKVLIDVKSLRTSYDYGLNLSDATRYRIQTTLLSIFNWFGSGTVINGVKTGNVIPGKTGIFNRAVRNKTADRAGRFVISAPKVSVERYEDLEVDLDYSAVPLAGVCVNFYDYMLFYVRRFFENEFSASASYPILNSKTGEIEYVQVKDYQSEFSDERIHKEVDRFVHGYSNRFIPVEIPIIDSDGKERKVRMGFKGYNTTPEEYKEGSIGKTSMINRDITWCDILFMAASEVVKDKHVLVTRYPIDTCFNQFPTKIRVASTTETEPMLIGDKYYPRYPKIRQEDILQNTSDKFVDTFQLCNLYLGAIGGDYDGDQVTDRGVYEIEANEELEEFMQSTANYIDFGCNPLRENSNEALMTLYSLTLSLSEDKKILGRPEF